mgnify:CR=1 FL=1
MLKSQSYPTKPQAKGRGKARASKINCKFCGKTYLKRKEDCPAWGKNGVGCGEKTHLLYRAQIPSLPNNINQSFKQLILASILMMQVVIVMTILF